MLLKKLFSVIGEIRKDIEGIPDLIPDDKKKVIKELIIKAAIMWGEAKIREKINE